MLSSATSTSGRNLPNRSPCTPPYATCASRLDAAQGEVCSGPRPKRAGEAPSEFAGGLSCPFQLFQSFNPRPNPAACLHGVRIPHTLISEPSNDLPNRKYHLPIIQGFCQKPRRCHDEPFGTVQDDRSSGANADHSLSMTCNRGPGMQARFTPPNLTLGF